MLRKRILGISFVFLLIGLIMVYSSSAIYAWKQYGDHLFFLKRQLISVVLGIFSMVICMFLDLDTLRKFSKALLLIGIVFLCAVLVPQLGRKVSGARRWFKISFFNIQPSEIFKIFYLLYLADYITRKKAVIKSFSKGVLPLMIVTAFSAACILLEPDLGNAVFLSILMMIFLFIAGADIKKFCIIALGCAVILLLLIVISPYRRERLMTYFNPWAAAQGKGFQAVQSQISFGTGGVSGEGLGSGRQKLFFLPAAYTDFIYAIIGEEFGLIGTVGVLFLYLFFMVTAFRLTSQVPDPFRFYVALGCVLTIGIQAGINMAVATGLLPTKGLPLPFISYGGSSTVANLSLLGIFLNATKGE